MCIRDSKYFLPVHGEYKQLKKHALTAASLGIPTSNILIAENLSLIHISPGYHPGSYLCRSGPQRPRHC